MIEVDRVTVSFGNGVRALSDVSLGIRASEFTVLLGHSGAGKSTLLRTLNLLARPTSGRIVVDGEELQPGRALREHRRCAAMIFQLHQLIGRHTALQNVLTGRIGYYPSWRTLLPSPREDVDRALRCLDRVGLLQRAGTRCDALSGGERQRVGIARALCQEPRYVLADEPVASLDPVASERVLGFLRGICAEDGLTAVVSLHQVEYARRFAERIVGLCAGRIVFDGPSEDLNDAALARIYSTTEAPARAPDPVTQPVSNRRTSHETVS